ncbi:MAG: four helix bundle protein [Armatimonadetes bacterium]|nr:four helix bundle protein [Armatimonadota bacterium]
MAVKSYRELDVWQVGMDVAEACYHLTCSFPKSELYGMTSQIRSAAASIPATVAEGFERELHRDFARFCRIAQGSLHELETHLLLCVRVGLASSGPVDAILAQADRLGRQLKHLIRFLKSEPDDLVWRALRRSRSGSTRHQAPGTRHQAPRSVDR